MIYGLKIAGRHDLLDAQFIRKARRVQYKAVPYRSILLCFLFPVRYWKPIDVGLTLTSTSCQGILRWRIILADVSHIDIEPEDATLSRFLSGHIETNGWRLDGANKKWFLTIYIPIDKKTRERRRENKTTEHETRKKEMDEKRTLLQQLLLHG